MHWITTNAFWYLQLFLPAVWLIRTNMRQAWQRLNIISKKPFHIFYYTRPPTITTLLFLQSKYWFDCTQHA